MFWKFDLHSNSSLDTILSKEDCTLLEILDEDDVLQECKSQNRKLLDFLIKPEVLEELVDLITKEPADDDVDEKLKYKYPNIACELLISDVQIIVEHLTIDNVLLNKLWTFLETEKSLNPLLASFFSKVLSLLICRRTTIILEFLKSKENPVDCILRHIDTSAIMDLVLRLATNVEDIELRYELLQWLNEEKLIEKLVDLVDPQFSSDKIGNASQALCDLIKTSREFMMQLQENAYPDPLLASIENKSKLTTLLDHMLHEVHMNSSSDALVGGVSVLLTLLEVNKANSESPFATVELNEPVTALDAERLAHGVTTTLSALVPRLEGFHKILTDPPPVPVMITTAGELDPPFGKSRLQVMKLLSAVLQTNSEDANKELANLKTLHVMWELFFQYPWNNFLHSEVEHCINTIVCDSPVEEGDGDHLLLIDLMKDINIIHKITEIFSSQEKSKDNGSKRHGYMGHLTKIANDIYQGMEKGKNNEKITALYNDLEQDDKDSWEQFVSGKLAEINKRNTTDLAGRHPLHSSDDDDDYRPVSFLRNGNLTSYQQNFAHYQLQNMAPEFLDNIGFDEEQFPESDEHMTAPFDRIGDVNFSIDANDDNPNSAMFEAACNERIHAFDDNDSDDEDVWPAKEISFSSAIELRGSASEESESSGSEEEEVQGRDEKTSLKTSEDDSEQEHATASSVDKEKPNEENKMDVDHNDILSTWPANFEADPVSMDVQSADPVSVGWENSPSNKDDHQDNQGWAKFDDIITNIPDSSSQPEDFGPRCSSPVDMDTDVLSPNPSAGSLYVVVPDEEEMIDEHSKNQRVPESTASGDPEQPEDKTVTPTTENREEPVPPVSVADQPVPLAPCEDDAQEEETVQESSSESEEQNNTSTSKVNGATSDDTQENKANEQTSDTEACTSSPGCERTCEQPEPQPEENTEEEQDNRPDQTQIENTESGTSPEKIPVSARNGPSLS